MVEWNRIFRLFLFSGILGQAREVHLKLRNEIPENVLSIRSLPGISGIFGRMESALDNRLEKKYILLTFFSFTPISCWREVRHINTAWPLSTIQNGGLRCRFFRDEFLQDSSYFSG